MMLPVIVLAVDNVQQIYNPISESFGEDATIGDLLAVLLKAITYIAIPIIVLAFIFSGFKFVKAQGESKAISEAKMNLWYTILATAIILGSNVILEVIIQTTKSLGIG